MVGWIVLAVVIALLLLGGWLVDRRAAKRGYRVNVRHTGFRRVITYSKIDGSEDEYGADGRPSRPDRPDQPDRPDRPGQPERPDQP